MQVVELDGALSTRILFFWLFSTKSTLQTTPTSSASKLTPNSAPAHSTPPLPSSDSSPPPPPPPRAD